MAVKATALEFLGQLEREETAILTWGLLDGFFAEDELEERAENFLAQIAARLTPSCCDISAPEMRPSAAPRNASSILASRVIAGQEEQGVGGRWGTIVLKLGNRDRYPRPAPSGSERPPK